MRLAASDAYDILEELDQDSHATKQIAVASQSKQVVAFRVKPTEVGAVNISVGAFESLGKDLDSAKSFTLQG